MSPVQFIRNRLTQPVRNAAGRMALARIVYSLFFLWHLSYMDMREIAGIPHWLMPSVYNWLPKPGITLQFLDPLLVFLLILLLVGLYTRFVTGALLIVAAYWALLHHAIAGSEQLLAFMTFYVPLLGFFSQWDSLYSVDAARRQHIPEPDNDSWIYYWPAKWMLIILSLMYFTAGLYKVTAPAGWLADPMFLSRFLQVKAIDSFIYNGSEIVPLALLLGQEPLLTVPAQYAVLFFELSFPLVLISGFVYGLYMRALPFFHLMNALLPGIPFYLILPAYILLVDWQHIADRLSLPLERIRRLSIKPIYIIGGALLIALAWNTVFVPRFVVGVGGLFDDNRTLWVVIAVCALAWYALEFKHHSQRRREASTEQTG